MFHDLSKVSQGCVGLGSAIAYFVSKGFVVSLPLVDNQDYDLIIDDGTLRKVQVKTTGTLNRASKYYIVQLKSVRSNRNKNVIKNFDTTTTDYLFILTGNGDKYVIPCSEIVVGSALTLHKALDKYKI